MTRRRAQGPDLSPGDPVSLHNVTINLMHASSWQERMDEASGSMFARHFCARFIVTLCERPGPASEKPCGNGLPDRVPNGYLVTSPLSPLYDLVMVYPVVSGASTTRTSLGMEVDCMPDRYRSPWRRCRLRDQVDRGLIAAFQGGGRPLPLAA